MTDERFERVLRDAAQDYHRPPATPREEMWRQVLAARDVRRRRRVMLRPRLRWGVGIAAVLALGVAIGRWTPTGSPGVAGARPAAGRPVAFGFPRGAAPDLTPPR